MGMSGTSGPMRGAYCTLDFATASQGSGTSSTIWSWNVPAGMDIVIVDAQGYAGAIGTNGRWNVLAGGASIFKNDANNSTAQGVGLTAVGSVTATISTGVFGLSCTSIVAPVTPSTPTTVSRFYGAYVPGGATLSATLSSGAAGLQGFQGTIMFYPASHPAVVRSAFE